jgi:hypothetical protein
MSAEEIHRATLVILVRDTADVIPTETFIDRVTSVSGVEALLAAVLPAHWHRTKRADLPQRERRHVAAREPGPP